MPLSKQMAPAPSLSSAALPFSGGMIAFCLPSHGLQGSLGTAWRWGAQLEGGEGEDEPCRVQPQVMEETSGRLFQTAFKPYGAVSLERADCAVSAGS